MWKNYITTVILFFFSLFCEVYIEDLLSFYNLRPFDRMGKYMASVLSSVERIDNKLDKMVDIDCHEITDDQWDINEGFVMMGLDSISSRTKRGLARFRDPVGDLFIFDFIFKPEVSGLLDLVVSFKDESNNEVSLSIDTQTIGSNPALYWTYKKETKVVASTSKLFPTRIRQSGEVRLRIETIQKPDKLLASGFLLYTPTGKRNLIPIFLEDFSLDRFYNKEVFLHLGISGNGREIGDYILMRVVKCRIDDSKPELFLS